jgi:hypothetical protein
LGLGKSIPAPSHPICACIAIPGAINVASCHTKNAPLFYGHFTIVSAAKHTLDGSLQLASV